MIPTAEIARFGQALNGAQNLFVRELDGVFAMLPSDLDAARATMLDLAPQMVDRWGRDVGVLAADWYDQLRVQEGVRGRFRAAPLGSGRLDEVAPTTYRAFYNASLVSQLYAALVTLRAMLPLFVMDGARETIARASDADPQSTGWGRQTSPGACKFCRAMAAKGAVYTQKGVLFSSHHDCNCTVYPSWDPSATPVPVEAYQASQRRKNMSPAQLARHQANTRAWVESEFPD